MYLHRISFAAGLTVLALLAGCAQTSPPPETTPQVSPFAPTRALTPFHTLTPPGTATPPPAGTPTPLPSPTPTPILHNVVRGETLGIIAFNYGVTVDALLAANPGINANAMSIGTQLVIPPGADAVAIAENAPVEVPAPEAVELGAVACHRSQENAAWCFVLATNPGESGLENVSAVIRMRAASGGEVISGVALAPLNILPGGQRTVLAVYFAPPVPDNPVASAELLSALPLPAGDTRYLPATLEKVKIEILPGSKTAQVHGSVVIAGEQPAGVIWVSALALDAAGQPVGVRRFESGVPAGQSGIGFDFAVYSSAGAIATVELLLEARP